MVRDRFKQNGDKLFGMYKTLLQDEERSFITKNQIEAIMKVEIESEINKQPFKIYF
jgi:hypothetical protein